MSLRDMRHADLRHLALAVAGYYGIPESEFIAVGRRGKAEVWEARRAAAIVMSRRVPKASTQEIAAVVNVRDADHFLRRALSDPSAIKQAESILLEMAA